MDLMWILKPEIGSRMCQQYEEVGCGPEPIRDGSFLMLRKLGCFSLLLLGGWPEWREKSGWETIAQFGGGSDFADLNELKPTLFCCRKLNTLELRRLREGGQQQQIEENEELSPSKKRSTESGGRGAVSRVSAARNLFSSGSRSREDPREHQDLTREEIALMFMEVSWVHWGKLTRGIDNWKITIYLFFNQFLRFSRQNVSV